MNFLALKNQSKRRRASRVRSTIHGSSQRPRLSVHISNLHVTAQLLDDTTGQSLAYVTTVGQKQPGKTMTERAAWVGGEIAKKAAKKKVSKVVFDRGNRKYHGRMKALAETAREGGLEF